MRIATLMAVLIAGLTVGCGSVQPVMVDEQGVEQVTTSQPESPSALAAPCKSAWTCDSIKFYSTQAQCTTACGANGPCYRDYACTGGCVCP